MPGVDSFCQFTYPLKVHFRSVKIIDSRHIFFTTFLSSWTELLVFIVIQRYDAKHIEIYADLRTLSTIHTVFVSRNKVPHRTHRPHLQ